MYVADPLIPQFRLATIGNVSVELHVYLPSDYPSYQNLGSKTDMTLLKSVIFGSHHVLRPIFPLSSSGALVCTSASSFLTYSMNFIPRIPSVTHAGSGLELSCCSLLHVVRGD